MNTEDPEPNRTASTPAMDEKRSKSSGDAGDKKKIKPKFGMPPSAAERKVKTKKERASKTFKRQDSLAVDPIINSAREEKYKEKDGEG